MLMSTLDGVSIAKCDKGEGDACALMKHLRTFFSVYGAPQEVDTDGGQPFA